MEMDGDCVALLTAQEWPADTHDCIFLGRALKQLETISASLGEARDRMIDAIDCGELFLRCRPVFEKENLFGHVQKEARTPEGWRDCLTYFCIVEKDRDRRRPSWRRRAIPQPHWLFVTKKSLDELVARISESQRPSRGGRKPEFDWDVILSEAQRLMDHHGEFDTSDPEWNAQARLEEALKSYSQKKWGREPSTAVLRERLARWLPEWRGRKR